MSNCIAVASGKGGTGKTSVAVNLYHFLNKSGHSTRLADCDVEEPNARLFFADLEQTASREILQEIPRIDNKKCTYCRACAEYCEFNAILVIPPTEFAEVNPALCHSCGACLIACEQDAIIVENHPIGKINEYSTGAGMGISEGILKLGSAMQTMAIRELNKSLHTDTEFLIRDSPPGTSCPVVESIADCDFLVLVTEPTPFGLHDLKLMLALVSDMQLPYGVIINKAGMGSLDLGHLLQEENIEILGELPFDRDYARDYAEGILFEHIPPAFEKAYTDICRKILSKFPLQ